MNKFIVGVTGGIGSGKTTITTMFAELGIEIIDADIEARKVVEVGSSALAKITDYFGKEVLKDNGELNRSHLRTLIFSNEENKQWLNALLHPLIRQSILNALKSTSSKYCILSAPLLIENNLHEIVDRVLVIDVMVETQIQRTMLRDKSNQQEVMAIINSQIPRAERISYADDIISNEETDLTDVSINVTRLHNDYLLRCDAKNS